MDLLIIEDDAAVRGPLDSAAVRRGYHVRVASDAVDALVVITQRRPNVVLLDVASAQTPEGRNLLDRLAHDGIPAFVHAGRVIATAGALAAEHGVRDVLVPQITPDDLFKRLESDLLNLRPPWGPRGG